MSETLLYTLVQVFNFLLLAVFFYLYRHDKPMGKLFLRFEDNYVMMFLLFFLFAIIFVLLALRVIYFVYLTLETWGVL
jgi:hypothetical protein